MAPPPDSAAAVEPVADLPALGLARRLSARALARVVVGTEMLALALFGIVHTQTLIPREDEVLALFVGRGSFGGALHQVLTERGGAPLHFVTAWTVVHLGGHLLALRLVSTAFAVAALPLVAALGTRIGRDPRVGVVAATLTAPCWLVLFNADFARMYAQFLFFATLAPLLLLRALEHGRTRDWVFWWLGCLGVLASHPYGAFVLAAGIATVLATGWRERRNWVRCAVPVVAAIPFWVADLVLRSRFDVGVGGGGTSLGSPHAIGRFLVTSFRDATSWHGPGLWLAAVLAPVGAALVLARSGRAERVLLATSFALPVVALLAARAGDSVSPETRHLIFLLPYVDLFLAAALIRAAAVARRGAPLLLVALLAVVVAGQVSSARKRTADLFSAEPSARRDARVDAGRWLAANAAPGTLLMGYEPVFYEAWRARDTFSGLVVARADSAVAAKQLRRYCGTFSQGAFIFDKENSYKDDLSESAFAGLQRDLSAARYQVQRFDDYLVVLSRTPGGTPRGFLSNALPLLAIAKAADVHNGQLELKTLRATAPLVSDHC